MFINITENVTIGLPTIPVSETPQLQIESVFFQPIIGSFSVFHGILLLVLVAYGFTRRGKFTGIDKLFLVSGSLLLIFVVISTVGARDITDVAPMLSNAVKGVLANFGG